MGSEAQVNKKNLGEQEEAETLIQYQSDFSKRAPVPNVVTSNDALTKDSSCNLDLCSIPSLTDEPLGWVR